MRIGIGAQKYWVYWNYIWPELEDLYKNNSIIRTLKKKGKITDAEVIAARKFNQVITQCFIIDDNIRVKNPDGTMNDNTLVMGEVKKYNKERHCRATARAYSLQKAIELLFADDFLTQSLFVEKSIASGVTFTPKEGRLKLKQLCGI